jgi:hypothetical protein
MQVGHTSPESHGEQRRREKATLQQLNARLELVLVNIRRDNIAKARQIKDYNEEATVAGEVSGIVKDEQRGVDKGLREVIHDKSLQLAKVAKNSCLKKETDLDLAGVGPFETWRRGDSNTEGLGAKYVELGAEIANKKLVVMESTAEKAYNDHLISTIRAAIQTMEAIIQQEEVKENNLRTEDAKHREQLAELKKINEESARKVSLYENPELVDAMQERIQLALDNKEKLLQAELKGKIDAKAQELAVSSSTSGNNQFITPRKMDLFGEHVQLENDIKILDAEKNSTVLQLKSAATTKEKFLSRVKASQENVDNSQKLIADCDNKRIALTEDIATLKTDNLGLGDKKILELNKQITDQDSSNAVRVARFNKAKQMLLSALDDEDARFGNVVTLEAVLKEYERIIEDYEEQYRTKRKSHFVPPTHAPISAPPQAHTDAPTKKTNQTKSQASKPRTRSTAGYQSTASKEASTRPRRSTADTVGRLVFPEEFDASKDKRDTELSDPPSSADTSDDESRLYSTPAAVPPGESGKKKRKEPPQPSVADSENTENANTSSKSPLEITTFSAHAQKVVIKNTSSAPINLSGFKIRNCDYNISQLFPDVMLPAGSLFTINPRPKNVPAKLPKFSMFWQDGDYGTFEKESKGVRVLGLQGELICMRK